MSLKVCALYKTFDGEEWVKASIESIQDHVTEIVMVHSNVGWTGEEGNTVHPVVKDEPYHHIIGNFDNQEMQYAVGFNHIRENIDCDYVLIVDVDEIWESEDLNRLFEYVEFFDNFKNDAIRCRMKTYIKDVHYRVEPIEPCAPVVLVRSDITDFAGPRGIWIEPFVTLQNVFFHHLTLVRNSEDAIFRKIKASNQEDGQDAVDLDKWREEKWNKLPNADNFHMTLGHEYCWKGIKIINHKDLPVALRGANG